VGRSACCASSEDERRVATNLITAGKMMHLIALNEIKLFAAGRFT
jgi:hypothetical protein